MICLDTHTLIWFFSNPELLSANALSAIEGALHEKRPVCISAISVWEISLLVHKGRLILTMSVERWLDHVLNLSMLKVISVDAAIARKSVFLPGSMHPDPADRIITATCLLNNNPLVTRDRKLHKYPFIETIW